MSEYIRFCKTLNTKGTILPTSDKTTIEKELKQNPEVDFYTSIFTFDNAAKEYFDEKGSIKGYSGTASSSKLIFDFDCENNPAKAQKDVIELLTRFQKDGIPVNDSVNIFFSGNKGFHVELSTNYAFTPKQMKNICTNMATGLSTFDAVIYNATRLYRMPNTKHNKTKFFKIELEPNDLLQLTIDKIKEKAEIKSSNPIFNAKKINPEEILKKYLKKDEPIQKLAVVVDESDDEIRGLSEIDFTKCPRIMPRCMYALTKGVMKPGERNAAFLRLAAYYKNQGMEKDVVHSTLKGIARLNAKLYPDFDPVTKEELWDTVVSSVFSGDDWKQIAGAIGTDAVNPLLKHYCTSIKGNHKCVLHTNNGALKSSIMVQEMYDTFKNFAENFDRNTVKTGIALIDDYMNIAVGTTTLLVGACGSGKTTVALNIIENTNDKDLHTMFFSLDMHKNLVYMKLAQKLTDYTQEEIREFFKTKNKEKCEEIKRAVNAKYSKTVFDFSSTLTMEQMRDKVLEAEKKLGHKIKLVIVDYASRISGPHSDSYANARYNALKSTEVADATDAAWIFLSQISRNTGNGSSPLRTKRAAKESGDWEESATNVITLWRPFMGIEGKDDVLRMFLAKNRMGQEIERPLWWNGAKGTVKDMGDIDYNVYLETREEEEKELTKKTFQR